MTALFALILLFVEGPLGLEASSSCCLMETSDVGFHWSSPDYGVVPAYPSNFFCSVGAKTDEPHQAVFTINSFNLQGREMRKGKRFCVDAVRLYIPYSRKLTLCGKKDGVIQVPNFRFNNTFKTDDSHNRRGFNITISSFKTECHQIIDLTSGERDCGTITTPGFPDNYPRNSQCEWWIKAPVGKRIRLTMNIRLKKSNNCREAYVVVDKSGSRSYPAESSVLLCGTVLNKYLLSEAEEMNIVFDGGNTQSKGMKISYKVI